jgi:hypothetical protein
MSQNKKKAPRGRPQVDSRKSDISHQETPPKKKPAARKPPAKPISYSAERRLCDIWLDDKTKNPETGRTIQKDKGVYNKYARMCVSFKEPIKPNKTKKDKGNVTETEMCKQWLSDRNTNPMTGRKIKTDGPVYKKISKQCFGI